jgi:hypothetical protein
VLKSFQPGWTIQGRIDFRLVMDSNREFNGTKSKAKLKRIFQGDSKEVIKEIQS